MLLRFLFVTALILSTTLILPTVVKADFTFSPSKTTINFDEELELQAKLSLQGQANKIYYLQSVFKKEGASNYFGFTWNDQDWVKYSSTKSDSLKKITTDATGMWEGAIKVKLDLASSYYQGSGNYIVTLRRFTETGTSATSSDSENQVIAVNTPVSQTPTPIQSPTPQPPESTTPAPSPTSAPTTSPSPSTTPTPAVFNITASTNELNSDQSTNISITINNLTPQGQYYLKGAFFQDGSTNYYGKTKVGDSWIKNSQTSSSQKSITANSNGEWSGNLEIMPDIDDSGFTGQDSYNFKVARYSSSGGNLTWSNILNFQINYTEPDPEPSATNSPTPTLSGSANTILNPLSSPKPTSKASNSLTTFLDDLSLDSSDSASVAGIMTEDIPVQSNPFYSPKSEEVKGWQQFNLLPWIGGTLVISGIGYFFYQKRFKIPKLSFRRNSIKESA